MNGRRVAALTIVVTAAAAACSGHTYRSSHPSTTEPRGGAGNPSTSVGDVGPGGTGRSGGSTSSTTPSKQQPGGVSTSTPSTAHPGSTPPATVTAESCSRSHAPQLGVRYGPASLDVFPVVGGCAFGVVVFVHGGGYCCGDRKQLIDAVVPWFHGQGWAVVSVDYRLGVRYPAFDLDVAAAVAWVHAHAASFSANPGRIVLLGHSTGAEMVAEIATNPLLSGATGGVQCAGALDGTAYNIASWLATADATALRLYEAAYGTRVSGWVSASAISWATVGHGIPRFLVVERRSATVAKLIQQQAFVTALRNARVAVQVIDASSIGHGQVVSNLGLAGDRVMTAPMAAFLASCR